VLVSTKAAQAAPSDLQHYIVGMFMLLAIFVGIMFFGAWAMHHHGWDDSTPAKAVGRVPWIINVCGILYLVIAFVVTGGAFK
jgi:hypothetical protein